MAIKTADDLFLSELKDIYSAEKQAVRAYPRLAKTVQSEELKQALQQHLEQTKGQIERLDQVFEKLEKRAGGKTCEAMKGLLEESAQHVEEIEAGPVLDAALLASLQRVEHYEIAAYGTVVAFAEAMGQQEIQQLLEQTLQEEKETDEKLTEVSKTVNKEAISGGDDDEEDSDEEGDEDGEDSDDEEQEATKTKSPKKRTTSRLRRLLQRRLLQRKARRSKPVPWCSAPGLLCFPTIRLRCAEERNARHPLLY